MYISHPVRRLREDPIEGESVALVAELTDAADSDAFAAHVTALGGTAERLRFSWRVTLPQTGIDDLLAFEGLTRVETAETISLGLQDDARDHVDPEDPHRD